MEELKTMGCAKSKRFKGGHISGADKLNQRWPFGGKL